MSTSTDWEDKVIGTILRVTLVAETRQRIYLKEFAESFLKEGKSVPSMRIDMVDSLLMHLLSMPRLPYTGYTNHFDYLMQSLSNVEPERIGVKTNVQKTAVLNEISHLLVNYMGLLLRYPFYFTSQGMHEDGTQLLLPYLTREKLMPSGFVPLLVAYLEKENFLSPIFEPLFEELSSQFLINNSLSGFLGPVQALEFLVSSSPALAHVLVRMDRFIPSEKSNGTEMETRSILGPFFRMSSLPFGHTIDDEDLFGIGALTMSMETEIINRFREPWHLVMKGITNVILALLKCSEETRKKTMDWLRTVLNGNKDRMNARAGNSGHCTYGFTVNFSYLLLKLAEPFMDPSGPKVGLIDSKFLLFDTQMLRNEPTCLAMDSKEYNEYRNKEVSAKTDPYNSNFITQSFHFAMQSLSIGTLKLFQVATKLLRSQAELLVASNTKEFVKMFKDHLIHKMVLLDDEFLTLCFRFYNLFGAWLIRNATGGDVTPKSLPLPEPPTKIVASFPSNHVEECLDFLNFYFIQGNALATRTSYLHVSSFLTTFIASPGYVKNPHLRSKFVEIFSMLTPRRISRISPDPFLYDVPVRDLGGALVRFFVDTEITGASSQFFDKFNSRFHTSIIFRHIWKKREHKASISRSLLDETYCLRYANVLINDIIYLSDEALGGVEKVHRHEEEIESRFWKELSATQQQDAQAEIREVQKRLKSYTLLMGENIRMLRYATLDQPRLFLREEILGRLVEMLNFLLVRLTGPQRNQLKIKEPENYKFRPKWLIKKLSTIYLNFIDYPEFANSVALDGAFKETYFLDAGDILLRTENFNVVNYGIWKAFVLRVSEIATAEKEKLEDLGEIPDEFLDPLLAELMTDPVLMPTSGISIDRGTITRHLLTAQTDPFNRKPLTLEMLVPDIKLKERIDAFVASKKTKK